ncbi:hypothetical protein Anamo_0754 [Acetomicrobium mobile DSM 13181]|uniref:Uncharacterized protein n=1 Tax=Acetomicrobium mobile (strain ATCC BAA-54 / DSM 13181 / JCM 12221 / NGA) TaxID=891968 RepID=I4BVT8_ACEMN|nr:hypothetical protein [Acetomicrobium mobile]AFM21395.1 hypothetical protein Anamo_0754 [Acetomicrobium mobile DSM 13181]
MAKDIRKHRDSLANKIILLLIVIIATLSLVIIACTYHRPDRIFMDNVILKLIYERHSGAAH